MMRSPCCNAPVGIVASRYDGGAGRMTHWYACNKCNEPCDPVGWERAGNQVGKTKAHLDQMFPGWDNDIGKEC